jgi:hypothetical protein
MTARAMTAGHGLLSRSSAGDQAALKTVTWRDRVESQFAEENGMFSFHMSPGPPSVKCWDDCSPSI